MKQISLTFLIEIWAGCKLPNWLNSSLKQQLKTLAGYSFYFTASTNVLQKLRAGMLIDEILTKFQSFNSNGAKKLNDNKKLNIYSTHDTKTTALLSALGIFNNLPPNFGSTVIFELYSTQNDENFVKIFYLYDTESEQPELLNLPA
ncbi:prostatic acid phosphatase-like protein [Dinothrombium tinctorium]|uniref:acid phosphatase n=1 Tax=Dinothrombium tinctorium TaxID=1965070 RepID=A0A443QCQ8_9ACAR|nr:prostatic acid phosphatase-like protein [Dinothrombium tinctorium]